MENLDLIIYTSVVVLAFIVFFIVTIKEFTHMSNSEYKDRAVRERVPKD